MPKWVLASLLALALVVPLRALPSGSVPLKDAEGQTFCTGGVYAIGRVLTALHCVMGTEDPAQVTAGGLAVTKIVKSKNTDLAVLCTSPSLFPVLDLAAHDAKPGDSVSMVGYAGGENIPMTAMGTVTTVGTVDSVKDYWPHLFLVFPGGLASGMSGSPVLNKEGKIVGVHVAGFYTWFANVPLSDIKSFTSKVVC